MSLQESVTPEENIFYVDDQKFILLDEFNDEDSAFYVMAESFYGEKEFDQSSNAVFDVSQPGNIGEFLNNDFLTEGNDGKKLPQGIADNINKEHVWWIEAGMKDGDCPDDYSVTCGINLLSMSEAVKYQSKFGCAADSKTDGWWLRTQRGNKGSEDNILFIAGNEGDIQNKMGDIICTEKKALRPVFFLDGDTFTKVKIDVSKTGEAVKEMILSRYEKSDLETLYTPEELQEIGFPSEPGTIINGAQIEMDTASVQAGTTLSAVMNVAGAQEYEYQWLTSNDPDSGYIEIRNGKNQTYYVSTIDKNCYLTCRITPIVNGSKMSSQTAEPVFVETLGYMKEHQFTAEEKQAAMVTPEENTFKLDGSERTYILLDSFNGSDDAEFFVMADYLTGPIEADSEDPGLFVPDKEGNIAYWLCNNYKETGYEIAGVHKDGIESEFLDYVDMDHEWWSESGIEGRTDTTGDHSYKGPFSVLSYSEGMKYYGVYGWQSATEHGGWNLHYWTRTSSDSTDSFFYMQNGAQINDATGNFVVKSVPPVAGGHEEVTPRPVFYLSHEFFLKANLSYIGENVKAAIRQSYTVQEFLDAGYSIDKLKDLGFIDIPEAENVNITGAARVNAVLTGEYDFIHSKQEQGSRVGFEISDTEDGTYTNLCNTQTYTVKPGDKNKFIRFFVSPCDADGVEGETVYSSPVYILNSVNVIPLKAQIVTIGGEKVDSLENVSQIQSDLILNNTASNDENVTVMLWLYDRDNNAIANQAVQVSIGANETKTVSGPTLNIGSYQQGSYARLYVIDSLWQMTSILTGTVEVK